LERDRRASPKARRDHFAFIREPAFFDPRVNSRFSTRDVLCHTYREAGVTRRFNRDFKANRCIGADLNRRSAAALAD
jgi:hypothetical protein